MRSTTVYTCCLQEFGVCEFTKHLKTEHETRLSKAVNIGHNSGSGNGWVITVTFYEVGELTFKKTTTTEII